MTFYEDLTTFTEVDPSNHWSQSSTRNSGVDVRRDEDSFVYKSYGSNYFGDFEHLLTIKVTTTNLLYAVLGVWALTDSPGSLEDLPDGTLRVFAYRNKLSPVEYYLSCGEVGGNSNHWDGLTAGTIYYLVIKRDGTTLACEIYSDSDRTNLLDTITITCGTQTLEYLQCGFSREANGTYGGNTISGYCENLALTPTVARPSSSIVSIMQGLDIMAVPFRDRMPKLPRLHFPRLDPLRV